MPAAPPDSRWRVRGSGPRGAGSGPRALAAGMLRGPGRPRRGDSSGTGGSAGAASECPDALGARHLPGVWSVSLQRGQGRPRTAPAAHPSAAPAGEEGCGAGGPRGQPRLTPRPRLSASHVCQGYPRHRAPPGSFLRSEPAARSAPGGAGVPLPNAAGSPRSPAPAGEKKG